MSVITAFKCDTTGKLFEDKAKYTKHIRKVAAERRRVRKIEQAHRAEEQWWHDNFWNRVRSLDQLHAAIMHHKDVFAARGVKEYWGGSGKLLPTPLVEFQRFDLEWSDSVSNSHHCPHNGVTNWGNRKEGAPRSYPGWHGRFDYVVQSHAKQLHSYPGSSEMWKGTRIHTGTGGGGGHREQDKTFLQSFGFQVELFAADWPAMAEAYEQARVWMILKDIKHHRIDDMVNIMNPADKYFEGLENV